MADERTNREGIIRWGDETGETRAIIVPETTERPSKSIERCWSILAPLSSTVTFQTQERLDQFVMHGIKQGEQKGIDKHDHAKQLETGLQRPQTRAFQRQFAFRIAKTRFNLPTPSVREKDFPGLRFRFYRIIGEEIHHAFFHACFHQKQRLPRLGMAKSSPPKINGHLFSGDGIPDFFMRSIFLSPSNLPQLLFFSCEREKHVLAYPTDHETGTILHQDREPIG